MSCDAQGEPVGKTGVKYSLGHGIALLVERHVLQQLRTESTRCDGDSSELGRKLTLAV